MKLLFERVAVPMARAGTRGAWFRGLRVMAIDGLVLDVPDTRTGPPSTICPVRVYAWWRSGTASRMSGTGCPDPVAATGSGSSRWSSGGSGCPCCLGTGACVLSGGWPVLYQGALDVRLPQLGRGEWGLGALCFPPYGGAVTRVFVVCGHGGSWCTPSGLSPRARSCAASAGAVPGCG